MTRTEILAALVAERWPTAADVERERLAATRARYRRRNRTPANQPQEASAA